MHAAPSALSTGTSTPHHKRKPHETDNCHADHDAYSHTNARINQVGHRKGR
jgi:hypothetical protein